jgi:hypothetical protein
MLRGETKPISERMSNLSNAMASRPGLLVRGLGNGPEIQANTRSDAFRLLWKGRC